ncbi:MAG: hypothetical protein IPM96_09905 [Ignavibacteria bacterium]|nr:hypothetical protein [Ignavibacteria bacterium]
MKTIITKSSIAIVILIISNFNVFSQEKKIYKGEVPAPLIIEDNFEQSLKNQNHQSKKITDFEKKLKNLKESGNTDNTGNLEKEFDEVMGTKTIKLEKDENVKLLDETEINRQQNLQTSKVAPYIGFCAATCTEESGPNTGRIWTIIITVWDINAGYYDYESIYYSDNNGLSWIHYLSYSADYLNWGATHFDAEIVQYNGNKFLWYVDDNYHLKVINLTNYTYGFYTLNWPGDDYQLRNFRITSDNAFYPSNPYIYIIAEYDSSDVNGFYFSQKAAICLNPLTVNPSITYRSSVIKPFTTPNYFDARGNFTTDIAYYRNGGSDSIIIVESGVPSKSSLRLYKTSIFSYLTSLQSVGSLGSIFNKSRANVSVATNGGYKNIMITNIEEYSQYDWDLEYHYSTNGSIGWNQGYIDYTYANIDNDYGYGGATDLVAERNNPGNFSIAYGYTYPDNPEIVYSHADNYTWGSIIKPLNFKENSINKAPKTGINKGAGINNHFVIWSDSYDTIWSTSVIPENNKDLFLFGAIQGLYDAAADVMIYDTVTIYLRNAASPYAKIDSSRKELLGPGTGQYFSFNYAQNETPYYVEVRHRNALETWSADPVTFVSDNASIAFSVDAIYAYGNNQIQVDTDPYDVYAFYSGDVNQDGTIDLTDGSLIDNDAINFASGYLPTDLNGDGIIDVADAVFADNNSFNFVSKITP